jgi:2-oxoglutarate dehydrogenase E2 component (dihydrolipoamide succinyltransferase)
MSVNVVVPEVGESIVDARVSKWLKKEGDAVAVGDPLVELETDKIDLEVAAPQAGVLGRIAHGDGADVKVGEVLAVIEAGSASASAPAGASASASASTGATSDKSAEASAQTAADRARSASAPAGATAAKSAQTVADNARDRDQEKKRATPAARNVAQQNEVDLKKVQGSGDAGRVMKRDVEQAASAGATTDRAANAGPADARTSPGGAAAAGNQAPAPKELKPVAPLREDRRQGDGDRTEDRVRMSKRRATIARRLVEAQSTAAMLTTFNEIDMTGVMAVRERHKQTFKERFGVSLGLTAFFVKASVGALREFPRINAEIQGDEMVLKHYYDIGIAVGAKEGLVVPVLRDADRMSFAQIENKVREFARAADDGSLSLADLKGGTFTITNGGVFGSLLSTPILNPPQVAILGLHAIKERAMAVDHQVVIRPMMYVALTYDHRMVDGSEAVQFLVRVKQLVEDPGALLLE